MMIKNRPKPTAICDNTGMPITEDHMKLCMACKNAVHAERDMIILFVLFICLFLGFFIYGY